MTAKVEKVKIKGGSTLAIKFGFLGIFGLLIGIVMTVLGFDDAESHRFNFLNHKMY